MQPSPRSPRGAGCVVNEPSPGRCPCPEIAELGRGATGIESRLPLCGGGFPHGPNKSTTGTASLTLLYPHSFTHSFSHIERACPPPNGESYAEVKKENVTWEAIPCLDRPRPWRREGPGPYRGR